MYTDISTEEDLEADLLDGNDKVMTVRLDNATAMPAGYLAKHDWDSVGTSIDMTQADPGHVWTEPLFGMLSANLRPAEIDSLHQVTLWTSGRGPSSSPS